jgi:hypothetical protein
MSNQSTRPYVQPSGAHPGSRPRRPRLSVTIPENPLAGIVQAAGVVRAVHREILRQPGSPTSVMEFPHHRLSIDHGRHPPASSMTDRLAERMRRLGY